MRKEHALIIEQEQANSFIRLKKAISDIEVILKESSHIRDHLQLIYNLLKICDINKIEVQIQFFQFIANTKGIIGRYRLDENWLDFIYEIRPIITNFDANLLPDLYYLRWKFEDVSEYQKRLYYSVWLTILEAKVEFRRNNTNLDLILKLGLDAFNQSKLSLIPELLLESAKILFNYYTHLIPNSQQKALVVLDDVETLLGTWQCDDSLYRLLIAQLNIYKCVVQRTLGNLSLAKDSIDRAYHLYFCSQDGRLFFEFRESYHTRAVIYHNKGLIYKDIGESQQSIESYKKARKYFKKSKEYLSYAGVTADLGMAYMEIGLLRNAKDCFEESYKIFQNHKTISRMAKVRGYLGLLYLQFGDLDLALQEFQWQQEQAQQIGDIKQLGTSSGNIGIVYLHMGNYLKAIEFLQIDIANNKIENRGHAHALINLAIAYWYNEDKSNSIATLDDAGKICESIKSSTLNVFLLRALAECNDNISASIDLLQKALPLSIDVDSKFDLAGIFIKLSELMGNTEYYQQAVNILKNCNALKWLKYQEYPFLPSI